LSRAGLAAAAPSSPDQRVSAERENALTEMAADAANDPLHALAN
jgi:hypothetical protein